MNNVTTHYITMYHNTFPYSVKFLDLTLDSGMGDFKYGVSVSISVYSHCQEIPISTKTIS